MEYPNRSKVWKDIWIKKGLDNSASLLSADGFSGLISGEEFEKLIFLATKPIGMSGHETILECGCGAGAFLETLLKIHPELHVSGVDYSPTLLSIAKNHFRGNFFVADMTHLEFLVNGLYDITLSFSAFQYLSSEEDAYKAIMEMLRITKTNGKVYIGDVPDIGKREIAESIRRISHKSLQKVSMLNPDHLYLSKDFFQNLAKTNNLDIRIIDHTHFDMEYYQAAKYRFSVYLFK